MRLSMIVPAAVLLLAAACRDSVLAPSSGGAPSFAAGGNSEAAHACRQAGYENLFRSDGTAFANAGECTRYAARGGELVKRLTATLTNVVFMSCNTVTLGYELDGVQHVLETAVSGCGPDPIRGADQTISYLSNQTLRLFLRDEACFGWTFLEDGAHAIIRGSNPYDVRITDAGGFCEAGPDVTRLPTGFRDGYGYEGPVGNVNVIKTISQ